MTDSRRGFHGGGVTLRMRISLLAAVAVGAAIAITAGVVFFFVHAQLYSQFDADLMSRTRAVGQAVAAPDVVTQVPAELLDNARVGLLTSANVMYPARGGVAPPNSAAELAVAQGKLSSSLRGVVVDGESLRVAAVPVGNGNALVFAQPTDSVDRTLRNLGLILFVVGALGVLAAAAAGYAVARAGLSPVRDLTKAAERVARTEDLTPINVGSDDELGRLAEAFNAMLASLDAGRERERRLVADAGHELRTPLTSIRTNLDLLAQADSQGVELPPGDRAALLADVREQIGEFGDLIGDLVQLSRGAPATESNELLELSDIVNRAIDRVRRRAPGVEFEAALQPWWLTGDAASLERAVTNLLDNAAKWSPPGGTIRLWLVEGRLTVTDEGPGIPEEDRARVFERFYRSSSARGLPGSGLGLAIVAQAANQHHGRVVAGAASDGGALLCLTLPGAPDDPTADN